MASCPIKMFRFHLIRAKMAFHLVAVMDFQYSVEGKEYGTKGVVRILVKGLEGDDCKRGSVVGRGFLEIWEVRRRTFFSQAGGAEEQVEVTE